MGWWPSRTIGKQWEFKPQHISIQLKFLHLTQALFHAVQLAQAAFEAGHAGLKQIPGCMKRVSNESMLVLWLCVIFKREKNQGQCKTGANGQKFEVLGMVFDPYFGVIPNGPREFSISHRKLDTESHPVLIANATKRFCQSNDPATQIPFRLLGGLARRRCEPWGARNLKRHFAHHFSAFRSPFLLTIFCSLLGWVGLVHFGCVSTFFHFFSRDYCLPSGGISHWGFARCGGITLHFRTATGLPICFSCEWKGRPGDYSHLGWMVLSKVYWSRSGTTQLGATSWHFWAAGGWGSQICWAFFAAWRGVMHWGGVCCW